MSREVKANWESYILGIKWLLDVLIFTNTLYALTKSFISVFEIMLLNSVKTSDMYLLHMYALSPSQFSFCAIVPL